MANAVSYDTIQWRHAPAEDGRYTWTTQADGITLRSTEPLDEKEAQAYASRARSLFNNVKRVNVEIDGDEVVLSYDLAQGNFERIRRITGYLVGTLDRFNNAKRAEERERVKHGIAM